MNFKTVTPEMKRGYDYEVQVRNHIAIQPDTQQAWMWRKTPERELESAGFIWDYDQQRLKRKKLCDINENNVQDTGTDIIVKKTDNSFELVQAKNYASRAVHVEDLSGFFLHCLLHKHPGSVFSNSRFSNKLIQSIPPGIDEIKFIRFEYVEPLPSTHITESSFQLREHQIYAVEKLTQHFQTHNRAILSYVCGLGKTNIAAHLMKSYKVVIVFSPFRLHAEQNLQRFQDIASIKNGILVDSDGCRDVQHLKNKITSGEDIVISSTFASSDIIEKLIPSLPSSSFIVIDEFHNLSHADIAESTPMTRILRSDKYILFVSATPRVYQIEGTVNEFDADQFFGSLNVHMSLKDAISKKLITDYRVFIPLIEETGDETKCAHELGLSIDHISHASLGKILFLVKCMLFEGARKTIVYLATRAQVDEFADMFYDIALRFFGIKDVSVGIITSETTKQHRREQLSRFRDFDGFSILLNIRILSEVLDIEACDSIFIGTPCRNKITALQRVCRANRLDMTDPMKLAKIFLWADAMSDITAFVSSLKEIDPDFPSKISAVSRTYTRKSNESMMAEIVQTDIAKQFSINVQEFIGNNAERAKQMAKEYVGFYNANGRYPSQAASDLIEQRLAQWVNNYKQGIVGNHYMKERPEVNAILDATPNWRNTRVLTVQNTKISKIREHIEQHGEVPSGPLGAWLSRQRNMAQGGDAEGANYVDLLDTEFGQIWRHQVDFNETVKANAVIDRVITVYGGRNPPSKRGAGEQSKDHNFIQKYRTTMIGGKNAKNISKHAIKLFNEKVPGLLPSAQECISEYQMNF